MGGWRALGGELLPNGARSGGFSEMVSDLRRGTVEAQRAGRARPRRALFICQKKPAQMGNGMECSMHMDFKDKMQDFKEILCCELILVCMGCNHS